MKNPIFRAFAASAIAALSACGGPSPPLPSAQSIRAPMFANSTLSQLQLVSLIAPTLHRACPEAEQPGYARCDAILSRASFDARSKAGANICAGHLPGCYGPVDLQAAYGVTDASTGGENQVVAVVDAFGYHAAKHDLYQYRDYYSLPEANLIIVNQDGKAAPMPPDNANWDGEQALDLDMVSAICPNCRIVLVETNSSKFVDIRKGEQTALALAGAVSNSFGLREIHASDGVFDKHLGKVVTASSGDNGAGVPARAGPPAIPAAPESQPCGFAGVICVGGTSLILNNGARFAEVVWDSLASKGVATGSGCSALVPKPAWQIDRAKGDCSKRSATDVSAVADPFTGVAIYCTPCVPGIDKWTAGNGGTSASAPIIAAMLAEAGMASSATPASFWKKGGTKTFNSILKGSNERAGVTGLICPAGYAYICNAGTGKVGVYSGPAGWGTPANGLRDL